MKVSLKYLYAFIFILLIHFSADSQTVEPPFEYFHKIGFEDFQERIFFHTLANDETQLIAVGKQNIGRWDIETGELAGLVPHNIPDVSRLDTQIRFSPDGTYAIVLDSFSWLPSRKEKTVSAKIVDTRSGKLIKILDRPTEPVRHGVWSRDGNVLITYSGIANSKRTEVCFWDGVSFKLRSCNLLIGELGMSEITSEGLRFFYSRRSDTTGSARETFTAVRETFSGKAQQNFKVRGFTPFISWSDGGIDPTGTYLSANGRDGQLVVWNTMEDGFPKYEFDPDKRGGRVAFKAFSSDARFLFAMQERNLEAYDLGSGERLFSTPASLKRAHRFTVTPMADRIIVDDCYTAQSFSLPDGRFEYEIKLVCKPIFSLFGSGYHDLDRIEPNGEYLLSSSEKMIRIWNAINGDLLQYLATPERIKKVNEDGDAKNGLTGGFWAGNGKMIVARDSDNRAFYIWHRANK